ncbi:EAL and GGDEF domain-containing protein [Nakamurella deserti]|uniref:sensor domain-containing protein n=1 Tax=Nakamurella deserti TaxID=2164074 RepID=UPI00147871C0|nr:EAL domain-containing protein [Nakamurella deserti]
MEQRERALQRALAAVQERERALRAAEELAQLGSWIWEVGSDLVTWSEHVHQIFGTDPAGAPAVYDVYVSMLHPEDRERVLSAIREATATGGRYEVDHRIVRPDGQVRELRGRGRAETDPSGRPVRLIGSVQDVTELTAAAREMNRSRDLFAGVLNAATEQSIIATDPDGIITVFNTGAERMLGYTAADMIGTTPERLHDAAEIRARAAELGMEPGFDVFLVRAANGQAETREWTYITRDGRRLLASITVNAMYGPCGEVTGFIKVGTDITERVQAQVALQESESRFRDMFRFAPNGMMLFGIGKRNLGRFVQVNPAMTRLTGYTEQQLLAMTMADLVAPDDLEGYWERLEMFRENPVLDGPVERHWIRADGDDLWVQVNLSPGDATAGSAYVVGQVEDITARKQAEATLRRQALHDGLTGLPNRLLLMDRIEHALAVSTRIDRHVGVLYIDLDGFKSINDTAGHAAGDRALVHVAHQIRAVLRPGDTVARLGGDEFVVVCENLDSAEAAIAIAGRVLGAIRTPLTIDGGLFSLGGSIGVALSEHGSSPGQLLQLADQAMYVAKGTGKGRVEVSGVADPAHLEQSARATRFMRLTAELDLAVARDELVMFGQPVRDLRNGAVVAVETLLRWAHPILGILTPGAFLDVAEATDVMLPIGRRALRESCRMAAAWADVGGTGAPAVHVNVSGRQLESGSLHQEVTQALEDFGLAPSRLVLELTETHMPLIADSLRSDLQSLRDRGVKVAIDDLGTGYSSLTRITELPVDILKIDLSFVAGMETDPACAAVVRGVLAIGDALGLDVIAEGVESPVQMQRLVDYGCVLAQGYLYSRPLPEPELLAHLSAGAG